MATIKLTDRELAIVGAALSAYEDELLRRLRLLEGMHPAECVEGARRVVSGAVEDIDKLSFKIMGATQQCPRPPKRGAGQKFGGSPAETERGLRRKKMSEKIFLTY